MPSPHRKLIPRRRYAEGKMSALLQHGPIKELCGVGRRNREYVAGKSLSFQALPFADSEIRDAWKEGREYLIEDFRARHPEGETWGERLERAGLMGG